MLIAVDLDGTIGSNPELYQQMMAAWQAAGIKVVVLTGTVGGLSQNDVAEKLAVLQQLGVTAWDELVVVGDPPDAPKAEWLKANGASLLIDNRKDNAKAAADICPVLVPWQTRE